MGHYGSEPIYSILEPLPVKVHQVFEPKKTAIVLFDVILVLFFSPLKQQKDIYEKTKHLKIYYVYVWMLMAMVLARTTNIRWLNS